MSHRVRWGSGPLPLVLHTELLCTCPRPSRCWTVQTRKGFAHLLTLERLGEAPATSSSSGPPLTALLRRLAARALELVQGRRGCPQAGCQRPDAWTILLCYRRRLARRWAQVSGPAAAMASGFGITGQTGRCVQHQSLQSCIRLHLCLKTPRLDAGATLCGWTSQRSAL